MRYRSHPPLPPWHDATSLSVAGLEKLSRRVRPERPRRDRQIETHPNFVTKLINHRSEMSPFDDSDTWALQPGMGKEYPLLEMC